MGLFSKKFGEKRPVLMTRKTFEETISNAVQQAVLDESRWGQIRREEGATPAPPIGDPFRALRASPFDQSDFYAHEGRQVSLSDSSISLRQEVREMQRNDSGRFRKAVGALGQLIESATGGWVTIGGNRGLMVDREIVPEQLFLAQDAAVLRVRSDPHASGIVQNLQFYTIGQGVSWSTPAAVVTEWMEDFRRASRLEMRERKMVREIFQEGEYFWVYFVDPDTGRVKVRKWRPKEITEIETHKEDVETRLAYHREVMFDDGREDDRWYADINYDAQKEEFDGQASEHSLESNIYIQMSKYGDLDNLRGWPPMYSVLKWLKYLEDFVMDRARLHHERAKVVWFMQRKGTANRRGGSGPGAHNPLLAPKGGTMWVEDDSVSYRAHSLDLSSGDAERDALLILYAISSGVCQPMHVWNQRSDQQVYASIRKADTPFSQSILANQDFLEEEWEERDRFIIRKGVEAGSLPETVEIIRHDEALVIQSLQRINEMVVDGKDTESVIREASAILAPGMKRVKVPTIEVNVSRTFPDVVQEAPLDMAKVLLIHQKMGIVSDATLSIKAGYDWHEELLRKLQEAKQKASLSAMEEAEREKERKRLGLPNAFDQKDDDGDSSDSGDKSDKTGDEKDDVAGTPGGGRGAGAGAGAAKVSKDDLSTGGKAKTDVDVKKTEAS